MIAAPRGSSSGAKAHETALSRLDDRAVEPGSGQVELRDGLTVDLEASLADQTPRLAGRLDPEMVDQQGRQMDGVAVGQRGLRNLVGRLVLPHDPREVLLPAAGALLPVP